MTEFEHKATKSWPEVQLEKNHRWQKCGLVAVDDSGWPGSWQRNMTGTILHQCGGGVPSVAAGGEIESISSTQ